MDAAQLSTPDSPSLLIETALLSLVRLAYFLACRQYVAVSLFSDLRQVIREDGLTPDLDSPDGDAIQLEDAENGYFGAGAGGGGGSSGGGLGAAGKGTREDGLGAAMARKSVATGLQRRDSNSPAPPGASKSSGLYSNLASALFCLSFSESCMLFTLLIFGEVVNERARTFNWSLSLLALLSLIVFVIPLGLCFLLTHRTRAGFTRTLLLTLAPFTVYLVFFYRVGSVVASKLVVEGSHSLGLVNALLSRICVPGVMLIASLSGGGAVNTAWEAYEWRSVSFAEAVTESQVLQAERALYRARLDLQSRHRSLSLAQGSAAREAESAAGQSLLSRWTSSAPAAAHLKSLEIEVEAMERMERQMVSDVARLKKRREMRELGRSWKGRVWLMVGWLFSLYCVWRVFISGINLIFGYSRRSHQTPLPVDDSSDSPAAAAPGGTDLLTSLLTRLAVTFSIDLDVATWSRLIGLVLIGSIIVANMRNVLGSVSRIFKATSLGTSASFMLLFLAQLMAIYLLTSLISLPSSPSASTATSLLDTLPDFNVFSRLFDSVFLIAAGGIFVSRWIGRRLRDDEGLTAQYAA
ncbi:hypothetical protein JCM6882_008226 [Rhodosporidiobolus microsporus]